MEETRAKVIDPPVVTDRIGDVMIVGAGISGIQASLDLAASGFRVILVDEAPAIGGKMAQLDKTFPTNDCSMCIESPKFVECEKNPNIEIITLAQVSNLEGQAGDFTVTLTKKPRYVWEDKCVACGTCNRYCPVKIPDKYNQDLCSTKSIHLYFPQGAPAVSFIDPETCLFLKDKKCNICVPVCERQAIDFNQKEEKIKVGVGAIILAPGYQIFDPRPRGDYGYGKIKNVVTSLDFERILSASGPFKGRVSRPYDGKHAKNIAWIQCVGSRQVIPGGNSYCSAVCCMYAIKQSILTKEHDRGTGCTIFHNDVRAYGKEFEQYYLRAKDQLGVRFIKSGISLGKEIPGSKNVTLKYSSPDDSGVKEEEFDLVVLSVGMSPPSSARQLADKLSIDLDEHGFCKTRTSNPMETSRQGIFVSGAFQGPMDIPQSVATGSGAAALVGQLLAGQRGKLARERVFPAEKDVSEEEPKIGVFVCRCGTNIGSVVDVPDVVKYASTLGNVVHVEENLFACSADSNRQIAEVIKEKGLNRVVVSACTPRTHEPLFRDTLREGGINKYLFDMANIREHCSWVHAQDKEKATQKAKDIVRMSVARAVNLQPLEEFEVPVTRRGLVIGGGLAGMTSALSLAEQGFEVHLVEKDKSLGGVARRLRSTLEGMDVQAYVAGLVHRVYQEPLIHVSTDSTIIGASGFVGNFATRVMSQGKVEEIQHGVTIIATGAEEYKPTEYSYGKDDRVLTLLELEELIARRDPRVINSKSLAVVLCVGSRQEDRPHCSRICCAQSIKCVLKLREINPAADIYVLYRDMRTYGFMEDHYREAANREVKFIRYDVDNKPQLEMAQENGQSVFRISVTEPVLGDTLSIDADLLALGVAIVPSAASRGLSQMFKAPLSQDGFFLEAHAKLRPVDFATEGIFVCGLAHFPKSISETIGQAYAAAARAGTILAQDKMKVSASICEINEEACIGCGLCQAVCPFNAIEIQNAYGGPKARVFSAVCKGCGICSPQCPKRAITIRHFTDGQIEAQISALVAS
ncbi:MAG: CoB--CoM heterodisulfide reductase iron-sulfur subunit A family protein [Chloroflexi bacterium]|nr:CoB--CoM heterodisulfide reductase iron-sulfur subunit A family protein [Chloroflexota bacterium]